MINSTCRFSIYFTACLFVAGCAAPREPMPAGTVSTVVEAPLRADVLRAIGVQELAAGGTANPKLISAQYLGRAGSGVVERWLVESSGKSVAYRVELKPSPSGQVDYGITRQAQ